jgi:probable HAF family extracellular repeat protein
MTRMKLVRLRIIYVSRQAFALAVSCLAVCPSLATADYSYSRINFPDAVETQAFGINARSDIVGRYVGADGVSHGFLRRKGVFTTIDVPTDIPGATATAIATLSARSINARGDIIGTYVDSEYNEFQTYLLSDGKFTQVAFPGAIATVPGSINNAGDITGFFWGPTLDRQGGFIYKNGEFHRVNAPGGSEFVRSAQDNGRVLVGTSDPGGFIRWSPGVFEIVEYPGLSVPCSGLRFINQRGDLLGGFAIINEGEECYPPFREQYGFLLRDGKFTLIDFPESQVTDAFAINDDGVIVGRFTDAEGRTRGFRAEPQK